MPVFTRPRSDTPATARRRHSRTFAVGAAAALAITAVVAAPALAAHPIVSLPGSNFEIDEDANLKVDDVGWDDWASVDENRQEDAPTGKDDDSFGQGSKEDTAVPSVVSGSIPPNKSDLLNFGTYLEESVAGDFLHLFWHRVQEPTGTTNMDFEFNQSDVISSNGVTPERTDGDLLIRYDLSQGGTNPQLFLSTWSGDAVSGNWVDQGSLSASGDATGSINTSAIPAAESDGLGDVSPRTFGEATVDFSAIVGSDECISFGSAYLKSRSSDSFTSALKDFIAPADVDLTNCAKVIIHKETIPDGDTTSFDYTTVFDTQDDGTNPSFSLSDGGTQEYDNVFFGTDLSVTESAPPTGWALTAIDCSASVGVTPSDVDTATGTVTFDLDDADDVLECTYTNTLQTGALLIEKTRKHAADGPGDHAHAGVAFAVTGGDLVDPINVQTGADGTVCVPNLIISSVVGDYTVTETVPEGYVVTSDNPQTATVTQSADCSEAENPATVTFTNMPLTDITVSVDSQVDGGTASTIDCTPLDPAGDDASTDADGDGSLTLSDLQPGTYVCEVVVDP